MKRKDGRGINKHCLAAVVMAGLASCTNSGGGTPSRSAVSPFISENFDGTPAGQTPTTLGGQWRIEATNPQGGIADWRVLRDDTAPSSPNAFGIVALNHTSPSTFNIAFFGAAAPTFADGRLDVGFKAVSGVYDQGGGLIWRILNRDNYLLCRANPLEHNVRLYHVVNGVRTQTASADASIAAGVWHTLTVIHIGDTIDCALDGVPLLHTKDGAITAAGGVGLWTKADAITLFDDLRVSGQ